MLNEYVLTRFESELEIIYRENNIISPIDLSIDNISESFKVHIQYFEENEGVEEAIWNEKLAVIFLNQNNPLPITRETFFHEFIHTMRHHGDQSNLNKDFRKLQEEQAEHAALYASMPFYMIKSLNIPYHYDEFVSLIADVFVVSPYYAKKRVDQIKRRIYQQRNDSKVIQFKKNMYKPHKPKEWCDETKRIMNQLYSQIGGNYQ